MNGLLTDATASMRWAAVSERINVRLDCLDVDTVDLGPLSQELRIVDPLGPGQDLLAAHEHIVRIRPFL